MTPRERVIRTLQHRPADRAPRDLRIQPGVRMRRADELAELLRRFPMDIERPDFKYPAGRRAAGQPYDSGAYTDAWGCVWQVFEPGTVGEVREPILAGQAEVASYQPPAELLEGFDADRINRGCAESSRFVLARTEVGPFRRLRLLRGAEAICADLVAGSAGVRSLLDRLHDFSCRELETWAKTDIDGAEFIDEWGPLSGSAMATDLWHDLFKPLYRDYCRILRAHDKFAFFHCDGPIGDLFADLVEIGVDAVNCRLFSMDLDRLAGAWRGKIVFWGEIDGQRLLPLGDSRTVRLAVQRVRSALDYGSGGVIAQCEWGVRTPFGNVAAVYDEWTRPLPMHVAAKNSA